MTFSCLLALFCVPEHKDGGCAWAPRDVKGRLLDPACGIRGGPRAGSASDSSLRMAAFCEYQQINQKKERKVDLVFTTELYNPEEGNKRLGKCSARVFFRNEKPRPAVNVTCAQLIEKKKRHEKDYQLYKRMKQLQNPMDVVSIPGMNSDKTPSRPFPHQGRPSRLSRELAVESVDLIFGPELMGSGAVSQKKRALPVT
ncbi:hypothetical protein CB1_001329004 [Camelus ferus]|nr:hypothetical protein CB1_001329004 [Camelus ferus]